MHGHFQSYNEDDAHAIRSTIVDVNFIMALSSTLLELLPNAHRSFTLQDCFWTIFALVTLTMTWWPSYTNLTRIPWRYTECAKMNVLRQSYRK